MVLSNEKSAIKIIKKIRPDFYIKGNDYKNFKDDLTGKIVFEKKEVLKYGGQVILQPVKHSVQVKLLIVNFSTIRSK